LLARGIIDFAKWQDPHHGRQTHLRRAHGRVLRLMFAFPGLAVFAIVALTGAGYFAYTRVGTGFLPRMDEGGFVLDYQTAPGTSLAETNRELSQVEGILKANRYVYTYSRHTGAGLGGDHQARKLLTAPGEESIKEKRDRAILSTLLYHALRREELCKLKVKDFRNMRRGVPHLVVSGKGEKTRYLPLHPGTNALIHDYLDAAGHGQDENGPLFRPIRNNRTGSTRRSIPTWSTGSCADIQRNWASRSGPTRCGRQLPPMRSITRSTSPRCKNGSVTPTSPRPASTIIARPDLRIVRLSK
jgi:hypothetical protein